MLNIYFIDLMTSFFLEVSHTNGKALKKTVNEIVIEEVQSRDLQYLVESLIQLVENDNSHLKPLPKHEKINK